LTKSGGGVVENRFPDEGREPGCTVTVSSKDMLCPVCGGPVVPQRNEMRCIRRAFVLCVACDGAFDSVRDEDC
jgi:hypothetical protein